VVATFFSVLAFVVAIWGLMGGFAKLDNTFYSNLITFVLGVWLPSPSMKKPEKNKKRKKNAPAMQGVTPKEESIDEEELTEVDTGDPETVESEEEERPPSNNQKPDHG
jgi:hypothetical protein